MCDLLEIKREEVLKLFSKSEEDVKNDMKIIKDWLKYQPHLPEIEDKRIEYFLLTLKFSIEKTKTKIDNIFTIRNYICDIQNIRDPNCRQIQTVFNIVYVAPMKQLTKNNERVTFIKFKKINLNQTDFEGSHCIANVLNIFDLRTMEDFNNGEIIVHDLENFSLELLVSKFTPTFNKRLYEIFIKSYGFRISQVHIINAPHGAIMSAFLNIVKFYLNEKLQKRVFVHDNIKGLMKDLPLEVIPKDYGGSAESLQENSDKWMNEMKNRRGFFLKEINLKSDETKRPKESKNNVIDSMESLQGTFRKLNVD